MTGIMKQEEEIFPARRAARVPLQRHVSSARICAQKKAARRRPKMIIRFLVF
jgi:hypothetical protein